jgi:hypothetical protein
MNLQLCYNAGEDAFPLPWHIKERYGSCGFPERRDTHRPCISSNFIMGLDGRASFRELKCRGGGREVSRSREDRSLMGFLRVHHNGQLIGANTLREESGTVGRRRSEKVSGLTAVENVDRSHICVEDLTLFINSENS